MTSGDNIDDVEWLEDPLEDKRPVRWHESVALLAIVIIADLSIFRGLGYAGNAAFLLATSLLLWWGAAARIWTRSWVPVGVLLLGVAVRLLWCGGPSSAIIGYLLLGTWAATISGRIPFVHTIIGFFTETLVCGMRSLIVFQFRLLVAVLRGVIYTGSTRWQAFLMPVIAVAGFSFLFLLANPELLKLLDMRWLDFIQFSPSFSEFLFLACTLWIAAGWLRPKMLSLVERSSVTPPDPPPTPHPLYESYRNTLSSLSVLFVLYLGFELKTLWFQVLPSGFDYAGYAHQGAFWLTVALAMATLCLSAMFRGRLRYDPRLANLKRWGAIWSALNLLLAIAVYNRLWIYVRFNGLTRLRIVGCLGVATVVVGFILVLRKIS